MTSVVSKLIIVAVMSSVLFFGYNTLQPAYAGACSTELTCEPTAMGTYFCQASPGGTTTWSSSGGRLSSHTGPFRFATCNWGAKFMTVTVTRTDSSGCTSSRSNALLCNTLM